MNKKQTPKYITIDNYKEFKPSEFIRSFISDIDVAIEIGKPMDMNTYFTDSDAKCLPCLGGMACMNMGISFSIFDEDGMYGAIGGRIADLGDSIRLGFTESVMESINSLYDIYAFIIEPNGLKQFIGVTELSSLSSLKKQIEKYASAYEKEGY